MTEIGSPLTSALNYAWSKGVVPVIVTGNDGSFKTELKTANALFVTATGPDDRDWQSADVRTELRVVKGGRTRDRHRERRIVQDGAQDRERVVRHRDRSG